MLPVAYRGILFLDVLCILSILDSNPAEKNAEVAEQLLHALVVPHLYM